MDNLPLLLLNGGYTVVLDLRLVAQPHHADAVLPRGPAVAADQDALESVDVLSWNPNEG